MTVRFFDHDPAARGYRFIILDTHQPILDTELREATDEGFHAAYTRWELDEEGGRVVCEVNTDGSDCDGRLSTRAIYVCAVADAVTTWLRKWSTHPDYRDAIQGFAAVESTSGRGKTAPAKAATIPASTTSTRSACQLESRSEGRSATTRPKRRGTK